MNYDGYRLDELDRRLQVLSDHIDYAPANAERDPEARTWGRLAKVSEECGEVIAAYIGATGQNPRKGVTNGLDEVRKELLDVAVTSLAAYYHLADGSSPLRELEDHLGKLLARVGLT